MASVNVRASCSGEVSQRQASSTPVRRSEPKTSVHSSKGRLVVPRMEPRSYTPLAGYLKYGFLPGVLQPDFPATLSATGIGYLQPWL